MAKWYCRARGVSSAVGGGKGIVPRSQWPWCFRDVWAMLERQIFTLVTRDAKTPKFWAFLRHYIVKGILRIPRPFIGPFLLPFSKESLTMKVAILKSRDAKILSQLEAIRVERSSFALTLQEEIKKQCDRLSRKRGIDGQT